VIELRKNFNKKDVSNERNENPSALILSISTRRIALLSRGRRVLREFTHVSFVMSLPPILFFREESKKYPSLIDSIAHAIVHARARGSVNLSTILKE